MRSEELLDCLDIGFSFQSQPIPLQPQSRVIWGLSIVVLILYICCRGQRSSITRLQVLNWAIRNQENRKQFSELIESSRSSFSTLIKYDPGFTRAIEYAIADELVRIDESNKLRIKLLDKGQRMANEIIGEKNCLGDEISFLQEKGAAVTEGFAKSLLKY